MSMSRSVVMVIAAMVSGSVAVTSVYTVKQGDTLWGIARAHKMSYERLCSLNNKPYDWCLIKVGQKIMVAPESPRFSEERLASLGSPYASEPKNAKLLNEYGDLALFSGETEADKANNVKEGKEEGCGWRNSLFLRRRTSMRGTHPTKRLLTGGGC